MNNYEQPVESVANRLKYAMSVRRMNQADLIKRTGISSGSLSQYASGFVTPKQNRIYALAKALSVNEAWLMGFDVPMDREIKKANDSADFSADSDVQLLIETYSKLDVESKATVRTLVELLARK